MTHDELLAKINSAPNADTCWKIAIIRAVVAIHRPFTWNSNNPQVCCVACDSGEEGDIYPARYPCPTIQAIEKELL
jgi:hypothetical protein